LIYSGYIENVNTRNYENYNTNQDFKLLQRWRSCVLNTELNSKIKQYLVRTLLPPNISCIPFVSRGVNQQPRSFAQ